MGSQQTPRDPYFPGDDGSTPWRASTTDPENFQSNYTWDQAMADFSPSDINDFLGQRPKRAIVHAPWNQDATVPRSPQLPYQAWPPQQRYGYNVARTEPIIGNSLRGGSVITADSGYNSLVPTSGPSSYAACFPPLRPPQQQVQFRPPLPPLSISTEPARLPPQFSPPGPPSSRSRLQVAPCSECGKPLKNKSEAK